MPRRWETKLTAQKQSTTKCHEAHWNRIGGECKLESRRLTWRKLRRQGAKWQCHACVQSVQERTREATITKFATKRDRQVPRASGPEKSLLAHQRICKPKDSLQLRGRDVSPRQDAMKEVCSLRGGWARVNLTRLPWPVSSWSATTHVWTSATFGCTVRIHHLPSLGRQPPAGGQVAHRLPGRHSSVTASLLRCWTGLSVGRRGSGRPPPWCPQGGLLPAGTCWTLRQTGGDCNAGVGHRRRGHTCRTLPWAGSVSNATSQRQSLWP